MMDAEAHTSALGLARDQKIEVAYAHWSSSKGNHLLWRKAKVVRGWAGGEVTAQLEDGKYNLFTREHWRLPES